MHNFLENRPRKKMTTSRLTREKKAAPSPATEKKGTTADGFLKKEKGRKKPYFKRRVRKGVPIAPPSYKGGTTALVAGTGEGGKRPP